MSATLKEVAARAGVSIKTVSRVVNNQGEISDATRQRVRQAIAELGYRPNILARSMITGKTHSIGLLVPDISDPFYPDVCLGVESVAREHGYSVFLCNTNRDPKVELEYMDLLIAKKTDGLMICGSRLDEEGLRYVTSRIKSVILTPYQISNPALLTIDSFGGCREVVRHLLSLGHRRIGHIAGDGWVRSSAEPRRTGFLAALDEAGIDRGATPVITVERISVEEGRRAAQSLFDRDPHLSAIACYNDVLALGALQACRDTGHRVPDDIAITGFDDILLAALTSPPLTTMHVARLEIGVKMMSMLLNLMSGSVGGQRVIINPQLVVRESSAGKAKREEVNK